MIRPIPALLLSLSLLGAGCAHMDAAGDVTYASDAKKNYDLGQEALESSRYLDAVRYFEHVRSQYPYSTQAALADLAIGDTMYRQEKYVEAVDSYRNFLKLHPNHPKADEAQFKIARSYYEDMPSDFILFPPSEEKDQTSVRDARGALEEFLKLYPSSSFAPEAQKLLTDVLHKLAAHELYVADFYIHRKRWRSAVGRLERVANEFPQSGLAGEALFKLGQSWKELGEKAKAREALERLMREHPKDQHRGSAEQLLKSLA